MTGIYQIENTLNHKKYIGQALDIELRFSQHKESLEKSDKSWYPTAREESNSINDFEFTVLQLCSPEELDELEEYWINKNESYLKGYNKTPDGQGKNIKKNILIMNFNSLKIKDILKIMRELNGNAFKLYLYFYYTYKGRVIIPFSSTQICKETGLSHNGPKLALQELIQKNYVKIIDDCTYSLSI